MDETMKIQFKDLSTSLKVLVVLGWILTINTLFWFFVGFTEGLLS